VFTNRCFGLAFADLTTGDFLATEVERMRNWLRSCSDCPTEIIYPSEAEQLPELLRQFGAEKP
jgi:hypothetical protein